MLRLFAFGIFMGMVVLAAPAWADGVPVYEATKTQTSAALKTYRAANELFDAGQYEKAITAFRASHAIVASPNSSMMIARSLLELGRFREAHAQYQAALDEARAAAERDEKYGATVEALNSELEELESRIGRVDVAVDHAPPDTRVQVGSVELGLGDLTEPVVVQPGEITVRAESADGRHAEQTLDVEPGATESVTLELSPLEQEPEPAPEPAPAPSPPPRDSEPARVPLRPLAYVAGGVGVAGLAAFGVFGAMSNSKFSDLEENCPNDACAPERQGDIDDGKRFQTFANVGLVVGIVGVGAGVTLFILSSSSDEKAASRAPRVTAGLGSLQVEGTF